MKPLYHIIALLTLITVQGFAEPAEKLSQKLTRTIHSGMELKADLTKNIYRSEPYEAEYTVQIPYQVEEEYYVDIPYEETETYIDYETYYDSEYRCHSEIVYEDRCTTEPRCRSVEEPPVCHQERRCHTVGGGQVCENVEECGVNARGERICKTRQVCRPGGSREECSYENVCRPGGSRQECHNENVCHRVPRERQSCGYERVEKTRPVTKTRTVTKYRQEKRTRTVTRYREETRCCVTKYRDVFDRQAQLLALIQFPNGAELQGNESELFTAQMLSEKDATVHFDKTILGYKVANKKMDGHALRIQLELVAKYTQEELAEKTITDLDLVIAPNGSAITFTDKGIKPRVNTRYSFNIVEKETQKLIDEGMFSSTGEEKVAIVRPVVLSLDQDYLLQLKTQRSGIVLAETIEFSKSKIKEKSPLQQDEFTNPNALRELAIEGSDIHATLLFDDASPTHAEVKTSYKILIQRRGGFLGTSWKNLAEIQLERESLKQNQDGLFVLGLLSDLKIKEKDLEWYVTQGSKLKVYITATRQSPRLNGGQAIVITKEETVEVK